MVQIPVHSSFPFEEPTGRKLVYYDIAAVQRLNGTIPFHLLNETKRYGKTREFSLQVSLEDGLRIRAVEKGIEATTKLADDTDGV